MSLSSAHTSNSFSGPGVAHGGQQGSRPVFSRCFCAGCLTCPSLAFSFHRKMRPNIDIETDDKIVYLHRYLSQKKREILRDLESFLQIIKDTAPIFHQLMSLEKEQGICHEKLANNFGTFIDMVIENRVELKGLFDKFDFSVPKFLQTFSKTSKATMDKMVKAGLVYEEGDQYKINYKWGL